MNKRPEDSPRSYALIAPKPIDSMYHFQAAQNNPRATVLMHPGPPQVKVEKHETSCPFFNPGPVTVTVAGEVQAPGPQGTKPTPTLSY